MDTESPQARWSYLSTITEAILLSNKDSQERSNAWAALKKWGVAKYDSNDKPRVESISFNLNEIHAVDIEKTQPLHAAYLRAQENTSVMGSLESQADKGESLYSFVELFCEKGPAELKIESGYLATIVQAMLPQWGERFPEQVAPLEPFSERPVILKQMPPEVKLSEAEISQMPKDALRFLANVDYIRQSRYFERRAKAMYALDGWMGSSYGQAASSGAEAEKVIAGLLFAWNKKEEERPAILPDARANRLIARLAAARLAAGTDTMFNSNAEDFFKLVMTYGDRPARQSVKTLYPTIFPLAAKVQSPQGLELS